MLKRHEVEWVKWLAEQGMSRRAIALKTRFARDTVRKILDGKRPDYDAQREARENDQTPLFSGPIERCQSCGGRVYMPCIACHVRQFQAAELTVSAPATLRQTEPARSPAAEVLRVPRKAEAFPPPQRRCA